MKRDFSGCMSAIDNCLTDPSSYSLIPQTPYCPDCRHGFYGHEEECLSCGTLFSDCVSCEAPGICTECPDGKILAANGTACISATVNFANCDTKQVNYQLDMDGNWYCPHCSDGFTWKDGECTPCGLAVFGCESCDFQAHCLRCAEDHFLNYAGDECIPKIENCAVEPEDYSLDTVKHQLFCPVCEDGYHWSAAHWDCSGMCSNTFGSGCSNCYWGGCTECMEGYMLTEEEDGEASNAMCQPKIPNCSVPEDQQPEGLVSDDFGRWTCPSCDYGYSWSANFKECRLCPPGCGECDDERNCSACLGSFNINVEGDCIAKIETCAIPMSQQPTGLYVNGTSFICPTCAPGFYTDLNGGCSSCTVIDGCSSCVNEHHCLSCSDPNDILVEGKCVGPEPISNCQSLSGSTCTACNDLYALNNDGTECLSCEAFNVGCGSCTVNPITNKVDTCDSCRAGYTNL